MHGSARISLKTCNLKWKIRRWTRPILKKYRWRCHITHRFTDVSIFYSKIMVYLLLLTGKAIVFKIMVNALKIFWYSQLHCTLYLLCTQSPPIPIKLCLWSKFHCNSISECGVVKSFSNLVILSYPIFGMFMRDDFLIKIRKVSRG